MFLKSLQTFPEMYLGCAGRNIDEGLCVFPVSEMNLKDSVILKIYVFKNFYVNVLPVCMSVHQIYA